MHSRMHVGMHVCMCVYTPCIYILALGASRTTPTPAQMPRGRTQRRRAVSDVTPRLSGSAAAWAPLQRAMAQDLRGFLDIDDLEDIGALETHINEIAALLVFLSRRYFESRNCRRELLMALELGLPHQDPPLGGCPPSCAVWLLSWAREWPCAPT